MILEIDHWHLGYEQILADCRTGDDGSPGGSALMMCNFDVDAMASARILSYMLRSDGIQYQLLPCTSYGDLDKKLSSMQLDDVRALILLNFGAARNLTRLFEGESFSLVESVKVYIFDCRRPVHLSNIYAGENIVVFWDTQVGDLPSDGDNLSGNESTSSSSSSSSDEDDTESENDSDSDSDGEQEAVFDDLDMPEDNLTKREMSVDYKKSDQDQESDYDGEDERDDSEEGKIRQREHPQSDEATPPKRRKTDDDDVADLHQNNEADQMISEDAEQPQQKALSPRDLHRQRRERLRTYYSKGSFFSSPAAFVAFQIATQLRFGENGDLLWLAVVGVTDAFEHARLNIIGYSTLAMRLRLHCHRLFPNDMCTRALSTVHAEELTGGRMSTSRENPQDGLTKITFSENGKIIAQNEYRFFMLRHSSLYESMVHSDYVSTKLQLWTKRGMHKLQELLAKMGYPLQECVQPFSFMKPSLRRRLHDKIGEHAKDFGLDNFEYSSFFRVTGYRSLLSASDTVHAVTALLECDIPAKTSHGSEPNTIDEDKRLLESFMIAYDALNPNETPSLGLSGLGPEGHDASSLVNGGNLSGSTGIGAGIRYAMSLQRSIISTAVSLVDRNSITRLKHFRYAYLTCTTSAADNQTFRKTEDIIGSENDVEGKSHIFAKPLALCRLAHYLMDMHRENGKWLGDKARPLVLMAEKPRSGTFLVVGYECPERADTFVRNNFGLNFELTAKSMNGTFKLDRFDSNVVEVDGRDVQRFIEQLHYLMDAVDREETL